MHLMYEDSEETNEDVESDEGDLESCEQAGNYGCTGPHNEDSDYEDPITDDDESNDGLLGEVPGTAIPPVPLQFTEMVHPSAGIAVGNAACVQEDADKLLQDPYTPFSGPAEFKLARWFVNSNIPKTQINEYFNQGLGKSADIGYTSGYTFHQLLDSMDSELGVGSWKSGQATTRICERTQNIPYFYRNPMDCIRFLLKQPAYRDHMAYAPVRQYNDLGERIYTELHTADWWWRTQVTQCPPEHIHLS